MGGSVHSSLGVATSKAKSIERYCAISGNIANGIKTTKLTTPKSMLDKIDELVQTLEPKLVYNQLISTAIGGTTVKKPKQVGNRRTKYLQRLSLSQDELFSTYKISLDSSSFVEQYTLSTIFDYHLCHKESIKFNIYLVLVFNQLLKTTTTKVLVSYDTTFNLTNNYVS
ncbi:unnamed protein product [Didymodactylos carnosus]|uniref:Uncharacterized protein n=1 Tax=Didymodactylos carnosus TaxID=1234261 RepID=A0A8S2KB68_9BILA|nr:unnamed protein product [Didymodactylos carnosus]CAF3843967.1 unnamed protein product [Didymodactylos carnosus]